MIKNFLYILLIVFVISCKRKDSSCRKVIYYYANAQEKLVYYYPDCSDTSYYKRQFFEQNGDLKNEGYCKNGKRNSDYKIWDNDRNIIHGNYIDDKREGMWIKQRLDSSWIIRTYIHDTLNGLNIECHKEHGKVVMVYGQYFKGEETGIWIWKDKNQKIIDSVEYINGVKVE